MARELDKAGVEYKQDYCEGIYSTDFLIERDGKRIALECKANTRRDMEKTEMICGLINRSLNCKQTLIVVPFAEHGTKDNIVALSEVELALKKS